MQAAAVKVQDKKKSDKRGIGGAVHDIEQEDVAPGDEAR